MPEQVRINSDARDAFVDLYAVMLKLEYIQQEIEPLAKRTESGWRNYRLAQTMLEKCVDDIIKTIPPKQLLTIKRVMAISTFKVVKKSVGKEEDDCWPISIDDLTTLVGYAVNGTCVFCDGKQKCDLRNILDDVPSKIKIENDWLMPCRGGVEL